MNPETRAAAARDLINIASSLLRDLNGDRRGSRGVPGVAAEGQGGGRLVDAGCGPSGTRDAQCRRCK